MFISKYRASFYLWWKESLVKYQKVLKHENDLTLTMCVIVFWRLYCVRITSAIITSVKSRVYALAIPYGNFAIIIIVNSLYIFTIRVWILPSMKRSITCAFSWVLFNLFLVAHDSLVRNFKNRMFALAYRIWTKLKLKQGSLIRYVGKKFKLVLSNSTYHPVPFYHNVPLP